MIQNGDIELWFKTDKKTLKRIKDALLLKKSVEIKVVSTYMGEK